MANVEPLPTKSARNTEYVAWTIQKVRECDGGEGAGQGWVGVRAEAGQCVGGGGQVSHLQ